MQATERVMNKIMDGVEIYPHETQVSRELLRSIIGHNSGVIWMTGLSGSGKSTLAHAIELELVKTGHRAFVLDGDALRSGLCSDLTFGAEARRENLRRAASVCKLFVKSGTIVLASFVSPMEEDRQAVRKAIGDDFFEIYVNANVETCEQRDTKGLYKRARAGEIPNFTGISAPYEVPSQADFVLNTSQNTIEECLTKLKGFLGGKGFLLHKKTKVPPFLNPHFYKSNHLIKETK